MAETVAIIGGSGAAGSGLALRWAQAGLKVVIGSRNEARALEAAETIRQAVPGSSVEGLLNNSAAAAADVVLLTAPLAAQVETIKGIAESLRSGAILVDTTVPLEKAAGGRLSRALTLWEGSAAERAARAVRRPDVRLVSAFHTLSAKTLANLSEPVECDVLICGDDADARVRVIGLATKIEGVRAVDAGPLENSRYAEQLAALLIAMNLRHKTQHAGFRTTGLPCE